MLFIFQIANLMASFVQNEVLSSYLQSQITSSVYSREAIYLHNIMIRQGLSENPALLLNMSEIYHECISDNCIDIHVPTKAVATTSKHSEIKEEDLEWNQRLLLMEGLSVIAQALANNSNPDIIR